MTLCWIIREVRMISWIICVACLVFCLPFSSAKSRADPSSRPLVISLPMRVGVGEGPSSSFYEDSTELEPRGEQRLAPMVFDPYSDTDYAQDDNGDQDNNGNFQGTNFLRWNPNNRFMVLQISDFIGSRPADDDSPPPTNDFQEDDEDEHEEAEDTTRVKKKRRRPSQQGTFDFEDFRRMPEPRRNKQKKTKSSSSERKSRKRDEEEQQEDDGDERDVYGTDPVVHYLKERRGKDRKRDFGFGGMRDDDDGDEFTMKEWWNY